MWLMRDDCSLLCLHKFCVFAISWPGSFHLGSSFQNCYRISLEKGECGRNVFTRVVNITYELKVSSTSVGPGYQSNRDSSPEFYRDKRTLYHCTTNTSYLFENKYDDISGCIRSIVVHWSDVSSFTVQWILGAGANRQPLSYWGHKHS